MCQRRHHSRRDIGVSATLRYRSAADLITALTPLVTPSESFTDRLRRLLLGS